MLVRTVWAGVVLFAASLGVLVAASNPKNVQGVYFYQPLQYAASSAVPPTPFEVTTPTTTFTTSTGTTIGVVGAATGDIFAMDADLHRVYPYTNPNAFAISVGQRQAVSAIVPPLAGAPNRFYAVAGNVVAKILINTTFESSLGVDVMSVEATVTLPGRVAMSQVVGGRSVVFTTCGKTESTQQCRMNTVDLETMALVSAEGHAPTVAANPSLLAVQSAVSCSAAAGVCSWLDVDRLVFYTINESRLAPAAAPMPLFEGAAVNVTFGPTGEWVSIASWRSVATVPFDSVTGAGAMSHRVMGTDMVPITFLQAVGASTVAVGRTAVVNSSELLFFHAPNGTIAAGPPAVAELPANLTVLTVAGFPTEGRIVVGGYASNVSKEVLMHLLSPASAMAQPQIIGFNATVDARTGDVIAVSGSAPVWTSAVIQTNMLGLYHETTPRFYNVPEMAAIGQPGTASTSNVVGLRSFVTIQSDLSPVGTQVTMMRVTDGRVMAVSGVAEATASSDDGFPSLVQRHGRTAAFSMSGADSIVAAVVDLSSFPVPTENNTFNTGEALDTIVDETTGDVYLLYSASHGRSVLRRNPAPGSPHASTPMSVFFPIRFNNTEALAIYPAAGVVMIHGSQADYSLGTPSRAILAAVTIASGQLRWSSAPGITPGYGTVYLMKDRPAAFTMTLQADGSRNYAVVDAVTGVETSHSTGSTGDLSQWMAQLVIQDEFEGRLLGSSGSAVFVFNATDGSMLSFVRLNNFLAGAFLTPVGNAFATCEFLSESHHKMSVYGVANATVLSTLMVPTCPSLAMRRDREYVYSVMAQPSPTVSDACDLYLTRLNFGDLHAEVPMNLTLAGVLLDKLQQSGSGRQCENSFTASVSVDTATQIAVITAPFMFTTVAYDLLTAQRLWFNLHRADSSVSDSVPTFVMAPEIRIPQFQRGVFYGLTQGGPLGSVSYLRGTSVFDATDVFQIPLPALAGPGTGTSATQIMDPRSNAITGITLATTYGAASYHGHTSLTAAAAAPAHFRNASGRSVFPAGNYPLPPVPGTPAPDTWAPFPNAGGGGDDGNDGTSQTIVYACLGVAIVSAAIVGVIRCVIVRRRRRQYSPAPVYGVPVMGTAVNPSSDEGVRQVLV